MLAHGLHIVLASIYSLKPAFQSLLRPLVVRLARLGVSANGVTLAAAVGSIAVGLVILVWPQASWPLLLLPAFLLVRMAMNAIDGMLAREHGQQSRLGGLLNELGDGVSDAALYLPLAFVPGFNAVLVVLIVVLGLLVEMAGVLGEIAGAGRRYDGPMGKSDRAFVFGALALWLGLGGSAGFWFDWVLGAVVGLSLLTLVNRSRRAVGEENSQ